jgi:hypothetical protein
MAAQIDFDDNDRNGECFVIGSEGEPEIALEINKVIFAQNMPAADDAHVRNHVDFTRQEILLFVKMNTYHLFDNGLPFNDALTCAYIRFLAVRAGLISPDFTNANFHVRINDATRLNNVQTTEFTNRYTNGAAGVAANEPAFTTAWGNSAGIINKVHIRRMFTDLVCCVAYMFRVRGHHYRAEFAARYASLWQRCLHTATDVPTSWQNIATVATHAIFPMILDDFWVENALHSACAGTLIKRLDSAPAGVAGISALRRGIDDICMLFPRITDRVPKAKEEFEKVYADVTANRWAGSINARYYGVQRANFNEASFGALASVVVGVYTKLADGAPLLDSPALQRLASIAPATGGAIGTAAATTAKSDRFMLVEEAVP